MFTSSSYKSDTAGQESLRMAGCHHSCYKHNTSTRANTHTHMQASTHTRNGGSVYHIMSPQVRSDKAGQESLLWQCHHSHTQSTHKATRHTITTCHEKPPATPCTHTMAQKTTTSVPCRSDQQARKACVWQCRHSHIKSTNSIKKNS
jgi:hypothetical protein